MNKKSRTVYAVIVLAAIVFLLALIFGTMTASNYIDSRHEHEPDYENGVVTKNATCTDEGEIEYICSKCGKKVTETVSALGHSWEGKYIEATCVDDGYFALTCSRCEEEQIMPGGAANGIHAFPEDANTEGVWTWWALADGDEFDVTASFTFVCAVCENTVTVYSDETVLNSDGTYTAEVVDADGIVYSDSRRFFTEATSDGAVTDVGLGATYTPVDNGSGIVSYKITSVPSDTVNLVVAGNVNGLSVTVGARLMNSSKTLETVVFEEGVTGIEEYAFSNCDKLESIDFCDTLTTLDNYAFADCDAIPCLEISNTLSNIGYYAFNDCDNLENVVIHGNKRSTTIIDNYAFSDCEGLKTLAIEDGNVCIGNYSFQNCTSLKSVKICGNLVKAGSSRAAIGYHAFSGDTSLTSLIISESANIPNNMNGVAGDAFKYCFVEIVYLEGDETDWETIKSIFNWNVEEGEAPNISDECAVCYYSEEEVPGRWHWGEDGMPVMWD